MVANTDQADYWTAQTNWVDQQAFMDTFLGPVLDQVLVAAKLQKGEFVLDIGCGTGASVLATAEAVGPEGHVLGVDISSTLLERARARVQAAHVQLIEADAQVHAFTPDRDVVLSRFGVMFFADTSAAFRNIATGVKPGGRFAMAAWAHAKDNPYFMRAAQAVKASLGEMPKVDRTLPGPFAFEDAARVERLLRAAGLEDVQIETVPCLLGAEITLGGFADQCMAIGPAAAGLRHFEADAAGRKALHAALQDHYRDFQRADRVDVPAQIHIITARKP